MAADDAMEEIEETGAEADNNKAREGEKNLDPTQEILPINDHAPVWVALLVALDRPWEK